MAKQKPSQTEALLKMSGVFKEYDHTVKLYDRYQKDKARLKPMKPEKVQEMIQIAKQANERLLRFINAYSKVNEEVKQDDGLMYQPEQRESYLDVLKQRGTRIQEIISDLSGTNAPTSK